jgi:SSS family transporter
MEYEYAIGLGIYFAVMMGIGFWVKSRIKTSEDYLVGARSFGMFLNTTTLASCMIGGAGMIAFPGVLYAFGLWNDELLWGAMVFVFGISCIIFTGLFYMPKLWRLKMLTLGDYFYARYGRNVGMLATVLLGFTFVIWVAVQVLVFAKVCSAIIGWSFPVSIAIALITICAYTVLGGLWAVAMTDVIQVGLVILGVLILLPLTITTVGGWEVVAAHIDYGKLQFYPHAISGQTILAFIGAFVIIGLGSITSPDFIQRAFSAKSATVAKYSAVSSAFVAWFVMGIVLILVLASGTLISNGILPVDVINEDPELLMPLMFKAIMPTALVILFVGAILAAVTSAANSSLLALAGVLAKNIFQDLFKPDMSDRGLVFASRVLVVVLSVMALLIAISLPSAFLLVALGFDLILSCLFAVFTLGLYWKKANGYGAIAGMLVGVFCRVVLAGFEHSFTLEGLILIDNWYMYTIFSPIASFAAMISVSLLTQKQSPPIALNIEPEPEAK